MMSTMGYYSYGTSLTKTTNKRVHTLILLSGIYLSGFHANNAFTNPKILGQIGDSIFDKTLLSDMASIERSKIGTFQRLLRIAQSGEVITTQSSKVAQQVRERVYKPILAILANSMQQGLVQVTPKGIEFMSYLYHGYTHKNDKIKAPL